ncbi:hypothetical protein EBQ74_00800, partial [bacterium]|nr:hypothetical protein [bacterium]
SIYHRLSRRERKGQYNSNHREYCRHFDQKSKSVHELFLSQLVFGACSIRVLFELKTAPFIDCKSDGSAFEGSNPSLSTISNKNNKLRFKSRKLNF